MLQYKLKMQYAAVMFGVSFGFLLGGFVYKAYYIDGVAIFGIIVLSIEARMLHQMLRQARHHCTTLLHNPHTTRVCQREPPSLARLHISLRLASPRAWQVLGTVTYFIITQKKVVELKMVSTCNQASSDQASAEVVSKFWPDEYMARTLLCVVSGIYLYTHTRI